MSSPRLARLGLLIAIAYCAGMACAAQAPPSAPSEQQLPLFAKLTLPAPLAQGGEPAQAGSVMLAPVGTLAAATFGDHKLRIWKLPGGELLRTIDLAGQIQLTGISDDGRYILTAAHDGRATVWESSSGAAGLETKLARYPTVAAFSRDSKLLAIAAEGLPMQVFDIAAKRQLFELPGGLGIMAVAFSRDGSQLATAGGDTVVRIYDGRSGKLLAENHDLLLEPFALDFTADGRQLIVGGGDRMLVFLDAATGKMVRRWEKSSEPPILLQVSPDGSLLVAAFIIADNMALPTPVAVFDVASGGTWLNNGHCVLATAAGKETIEVRVLY